MSSSGDNVSVLALEPVETSACFMLLPAISAISFFKRTTSSESFHDVADRVRLRVSAVISENEWLAGRLRKGVNGVEVALPSKTMSEQHFQVVPLAVPGLSAASEWEDVSQLTQSYVVSLGKECVDCADEPLFRVSLLKCDDKSQGTDQLAFLVSLSHVIADGATFYELCAMLESGNARRLSVTRRKDYGRPPWEAWCSWRTLSGCLLRTMIGFPRKRAAWAHVHPGWVEEQKALALSEIASKAPSCGNVERWVSTNDVLTAHLVRKGGYRKAFMALNLRSKSAGGNVLTSNDAGNYESALTVPVEVLDMAAGMSSCSTSPRWWRASSPNVPPQTGSGASGVRAILKNFSKSGVDPHSTTNTIADSIFASQLFVTNWASVDTSCEGTPSSVLGDGWRKVLHLPLLDPTAGQRGTAIIFRPGGDSGGLAVLLADRNVRARDRVLQELSTGVDVSQFLSFARVK